MKIVLYAIIHLGVAVFIVGSVVRAVAYSIQPMHLRWELYPVPHEAAHRAKHGGSYLEETDWRSKPRHFNALGELAAMVPEMLFMKGLWDWNRRLWLRSFPFHFGLYLCGATGALLIGLALVDPLAPELMNGPWGDRLHLLYTLTGVGGLALVCLGAIALLFRRLRSEELKSYTTVGDLFNLAAFAASSACLLAWYLTRDPETPGVFASVRAMLAFDPSLEVSGLLLAGLVLSALLLAYIPFTHMAHFVGKFFTYHAVRWNDQPSMPQGAIERAVAEYLAYRPSWAAGHVGADGTKTWAEVATTNPAQGARR